MCERGDIHREHRLKPPPLRRVEGTEITETGVVDKKVDRDLLSDDVGGESLTISGEGEVGGHGLDGEGGRLLSE